MWVRNDEYMLYACNKKKHFIYFFRRSKHIINYRYNKTICLKETFLNTSSRVVDLVCISLVPSVKIMSLNDKKEMCFCLFFKRIKRIYLQEREHWARYCSVKRILFFFFKNLSFQEKGQNWWWNGNKEWTNIMSTTTKPDFYHPNVHFYIPNYDLERVCLSVCLSVSVWKEKTERKN